MAKGCEHMPKEVKLFPLLLNRHLKKFASAALRVYLDSINGTGTGLMNWAHDKEYEDWMKKAIFKVASQHTRHAPACTCHHTYTYCIICHTRTHHYC